jgi:hypothetical protein
MGIRDIYIVDERLDNAALIGHMRDHSGHVIITGSHDGRSEHECEIARLHLKSWHNHRRE